MSGPGPGTGAYAVVGVVDWGQAVVSLDFARPSLVVSPLALTTDSVGDVWGDLDNGEAIDWTQITSPRRAWGFQTNEVEEKTERIGRR